MPRNNLISSIFLFFHHLVTPLIYLGTFEGSQTPKASQDKYVDYTVSLALPKINTILLEIDSIHHSYSVIPKGRGITLHISVSNDEGRVLRLGLFL